MPTVFVDGQQRQYEKGTTFEKIVSEFQPKYHNEIALVYFNRKMRELNKKLDRDGVVSVITTRNSAGYLAYVRTATLMLVKAVAELTGREDPLRVKVEFTLGNAYFCTLHGNLTPEEEEQGFTVSENGNILVPDEFAEKVQREMEKMRDRGSAITKRACRTRCSSSTSGEAPPSMFTAWKATMITSTGI